jgi:hypothetical protein
MLDINGDQIMDVLYQPDKRAQQRDLMVAVGTLDSNVF